MTLSVVQIPRARFGGSARLVALQFVDFKKLSIHACVLVFFCNTIKSKVLTPTSERGCGVICWCAIVLCCLRVVVCARGGVRGVDAWEGLVVPACGFR